MYLIGDEKSHSHLRHSRTYVAHRGHGDVCGGDRFVAIVIHRRNPLSLEAIVEGGLCIGCGLCQSIAGADRIQIVLTPEGRERPVARQPLDQPTLERINAICPGTRVEGALGAEGTAGVEAAVEAARAPAMHDLVWGPAEHLSIG